MLRFVRVRVRGRHGSGSGGQGWRTAAVLPRAGQAVALRRRRLRHPVDAVADPVEFARLAVTAWPRIAPSASILGDDVEIEIHAFDETNTRIRPERLAAMIEEAGAGMVMLTGVQSNQFPRALDLARPLRARGIQVGIGGFHVSGVLVDAQRRRCRSRPRQGHGRVAVRRRSGRTAGRGAARRRRRHAQAALQFHGRPAGHRGHADPADGGRARAAHRRRHDLFDAGRGCPYQCSFCTIINVQGRISRRRSPEDVEKIVRTNYAQGLRAFFITDDNFARNKDWEPILDRLVYLREVEKFNISFIIQVDTLCHKTAAFHREMRARRRQARVHRAGEHQSGQSGSAPRRSRTRSPNIGRCCWPGRTPALSPMPATSSASPRHGRVRSCTTST